MGRRIRVVHVLSNLATGGAEINTLRLATALARRGFDQTLVILSPEVDVSLAGSLSVPVYHPKRTTRFPASVWYLSRVLREFSADLVHGRGFVTWADCAWAKALCKPTLRLAQSFHGPNSFEDRPCRRRIAARTLQWLTDRFVAVSQDIASRLVQTWRVPIGKVQLVHNGVDLDRFTRARDPADAKSRLHIPTDTFVVGTVGVLREVKNHGLLLEAFARFAARWGDAVLLIVGGGPLRQQLEERSHELGLSRSVRFAGQQTCIEKYLQAMDVYVQPSMKEGCPTAVLEAMACGIPTVATRSSGCVELANAHGLPLLVDIGASEDLAAVLEDLASDEQRRSVLGQQARGIVVQSYSIERMVDAYEELYRSMA